MPTKGHHRSRSSIDRVIDLLADLEDTQISVLLDDLNHTTSSNVPVSEAIALFEHHASKPRKRFGRSPSPVRALQVELERRHSKRISSAPEPSFRSRVTSFQAPAPRQQQTTAPQNPRAAALPTISPPALPPPADHFDFDFDLPDFASPPSPTSSSPPRPIRHQQQQQQRPSPPPSSTNHLFSSFRPRSYKRISRPTFLSPTATAELHLLLLAFFSENPTAGGGGSSTTTTATPSPTTPHFFGMSHSPFSDFDEQHLESPGTPGLDLLEPEPFRTPSFSSSGRSIRTMPSMGSIFEVLKPQ